MRSATVRPSLQPCSKILKKNSERLTAPFRQDNNKLLYDVQLERHIHAASLFGCHYLIASLSGRRRRSRRRTRVCTACAAMFASTGASTRCLHASKAPPVSRRMLACACIPCKCPSFPCAVKVERVQHGGALSALEKQPVLLQTREPAALLRWCLREVCRLAVRTKRQRKASLRLLQSFRCAVELRVKCNHIRFQDLPLLCSLALRLQRVPLLHISSPYQHCALPRQRILQVLESSNQALNILAVLVRLSQRGVQLMRD